MLDSKEEDYHGDLEPCPKRPNCVSSQADSPPHRMVPLPYRASTTQAVCATVERHLQAFSGAKLVCRRSNYLKFTFTTPVLRFVDDVEFLVDARKAVLHFRSASRLGYSDLGANRRRMTRICHRLRADPMFAPSEQSAAGP